MLSKLSTSIKFINSLPLRAFATSVDFSNWTEHEGLKNWIQKQVDLMQPDKVHLCDGSPEERDKLNNAMVLSGTFIPVPKRPWSYYARSHPADVARVEGATLICSKRKEDAGPSNNWKDPDKMRAKLHKLYSGVMKGRTMYVIPFSMAPVDSPFSQIGVEITDSPYVVNNMRIMTHGMGKSSLKVLVVKTISSHVFTLLVCHLSKTNRMSHGHVTQRRNRLFISQKQKKLCPMVVAMEVMPY